MSNWIEVPCDRNKPEYEGDPWFAIQYNAVGSPRFQMLTKAPTKDRGNRPPKNGTGVFLWVQARNWSMAKRRARLTMHQLKRVMRRLPESK